MTFKKRDGIFSAIFLLFIFYMNSIEPISLLNSEFEFWMKLSCDKSCVKFRFKKVLIEPLVNRMFSRMFSLCLREIATKKWRLCGNCWAFDRILVIILIYWYKQFEVDEVSQHFSKLNKKSQICFRKNLRPNNKNIFNLEIDFSTKSE